MSNASQPHQDTLRSHSLLRSAHSGTACDRAALLETFRDYLAGIAIKTVADEPSGQIAATDVVENAIVEAQANFDRCPAENVEEFAAWLRQILINTIVNRYRDLQREVPQKLRKNIPPLADICGDSLSRQRQQQADERRLLDALSRLPVKHRRIIEMRQRDGLTFADIAKQADHTPDEVRKLWNQAIDALAAILQDDQA